MGAKSAVHLQNTQSCCSLEVDAATSDAALDAQGRTVAVSEGQIQKILVRRHPHIPCSPVHIQAGLVAVQHILQCLPHTRVIIGQQPPGQVWEALLQGQRRRRQKKADGQTSAPAHRRNIMPGHMQELHQST